MNGLKHSVLGFVAHTSIHVGSGESDGLIDKPIQRESHTDWPCAFGSGVKGALRDKARQLMDEKSLISIFGPEADSGQAHDHAGALMVGDARIVLLPVRSLNTHYRWVTCPAVLKRLLADLKVHQLAPSGDVVIPSPTSGEAVVFEAVGPDLYLEEYRFVQKADISNELIDLLIRLLGEDRGDDLRQLLTVVDNDAFRHICKHGTAVNTRNRLDHETKTVQDGALWTEESLPPETALYSVLNTTSSRDLESGMTSGDVIAKLWEMFDEEPYLLIGGNISVGMGWLAVNIIEE